MAPRRRHGIPGIRTLSIAFALLLIVAAPVSAHALLAPSLPLPTPAAPAPAPVTPRATPYALAPVSVGGLSVVSGDMADTVRISRALTSRMSGWRVERATSASGPWKTVVSRTRSRSLTLRVPSARRWFYRIRTVYRTGARGAAGAAVANDTLSLTRVVGGAGGTLRASNGSVTLRLPRGAFAGSTRVTVKPASAPTSPAIVRVTSPYQFTATAALRQPAAVTVRYRVPVTHFQVASTVARGIDWMCLDPATGRWTPVTTTVNTSAGTLTASMPHFSYWEGAFTQPHGTTPAKTDYCGTVCHNLSISPLNVGTLPITDSQVCYNCHGNTGAALPAAGSNGANIQGVFWRCSGQTEPVGASGHPDRAPGAALGLKCTSCHDPHKDPATSPKLLRAFDAVTGKAVASAGGATPGSPFCWACHGTRKSASVDAAVPGYYTRTGDKKTKLAGTPHADMDVPGTGKGCSACHAGHTSAANSLVKTTVAGHAVTDAGRNLCAACHGAPVGTFPGEAVFAATGHGKTSGLSGQALAKWPGRTAGSAGDCANCHDPHGTGAADYTRASGTALCGGCHDDASIVRPGDTSYRGGAAYAASAHAVAVCGECHAVHGTSVGGTTQPALLRAGQDETCLRCHSVAGAGSTLPGSKPYTWNGRDVATEFARASHHPTMGAVSQETAAPEPMLAFSQSTRPEFDLDLMIQTTNLTDDGPQLYWGNVLMAGQGPHTMLLAQDGSGQRYYDVDANSGVSSWGEHGYDPPDLPAGKQILASTRAADRTVTLVRGATAQELWEFTLPTSASPGAWTLVSTLPTNGTGTFINPVGADVAYDPVGNAVYVIPGSGGTNLFRWNIGSRTRDDLTIVDSVGTPIQLGQGACLAFSETPRALWIVRSLGNGTPGQGYLYRIDNPQAAVANATATDTTVFVAPWNTMSQEYQQLYRQPSAVWNNYKMTRYRKAGADYLYILGQDYNHYFPPSQYVISNLTAGVPTRSGESHSYPWGNSGDQAGEYIRKGDIEWDGGDWVYFANAMSPSYIYYTTHGAIPAFLSRWNVNTGAWQGLGQYAGYDGALLAVATGTPPANQYGTGYAMTGSIVSPDIVAPAGSTTWGALTFSCVKPAGTGVSVKVQGHDGSAWVDLPGLGDLTSGSASLTGVSAVTYPKLRLTATLTTLSQASATPSLVSWSATAMVARPAYVAGTIDRPQTEMLAVRPVTAADTGVVLSRSASIAQSTVTYPIRKETDIWAGVRYQWPVYSPGQGTWTASFAPNLGDANAPYSCDLFNVDDRVWWVRSLNNGTPRFDVIDSRSGATWQSYMGSGQIGTSGDWITGQRRGWAIPSLHNIWIPGYTTATDRHWYYRLNTLTRAFEGSPVTFNRSDTGTQAYAGIGGGVVYSPTTDSILIVDKSVATVGPTTYRGSGQLLRATGATAKLVAGGPISVAPTGIQATGGGTTGGYSAMELATVAGKDYAFYYDSTTGLSVFSDLAAPTPKQTVLTGLRLFSYAPYVGADLAWDGAGYLYLHCGAYAATWRRVKIPADPVNGAWGAWESLTNNPMTADWGQAIAAVETTVPAYSGTGYQSTTVDSGELLPSAGADFWGFVTWDGTAPANTSIRMTLQSWNGSAWADVPGFADRAESPMDLRTLTTDAYPKLRVLARLNTATPFAAPSVASWTVTTGTGELCVRSDQVVARPNATSWGRATWAADTPAGTTARLTVRGWNGAKFVDIPGYTDRTESEIDLGALTPATWPKLQLVAWFTKEPAAATPSITWWSVTAVETLKTREASLSCASCHDVHTVRAGIGAWDLGRASVATDTKLLVSDVAGASSSTICLGCHGSEAVLAETGGQRSVPFDVTFSQVLGEATSTLFGKQAPGMEYTQSGHYTSGSGRTDCGTCHDPHGSDNARLLAWSRPAWFAAGLAGERDNTSPAAREENLCLQCHGNGTVGRSAPGAQDVATPLGEAYAHPVADTTGRHTDTESKDMLGDVNRHSECVDCHDPHAAQPGIHTAGSSQPAPALRGATGVRPSWTGDIGTTAVAYRTVRFSGASTDREAYLCFKCHTSYTALVDTSTIGGVGGTDLAMEFNPSNQSYHNVLGLSVGVRTSFTVNGIAYAWPWVGDNALKNGLTSNSKMTCSDCHTSTTVGKARGPHGSSQKFMLDPAYNGDWSNARLDHNQPGLMNPTNLICSKCHIMSYNPGPGFNEPHSAAGLWAGVHDGYCTACHAGVPHGWKRPRLLAYVTDPQPYAANTRIGWNPGLYAITLKSHSPGDWTTWKSSDCSVGCTGQHAAFSGPAWP